MVKFSKQCSAHIILMPTTLHSLLITPLTLHSPSITPLIPPPPTPPHSPLLTLTHRCSPPFTLYPFLHPQPHVGRGALLGNRELTQGWLLHRLASKFGDIWKREPVGVADGLGIGADEEKSEN